MPLSEGTGDATAKAPSGAQAGRSRAEQAERAGRDDRRRRAGGASPEVRVALRRGAPGPLDRDPGARRGLAAARAHRTGVAGAHTRGARSESRPLNSITEVSTTPSQRDVERVVGTLEQDDNRQIGRAHV